MTTPANQAEIPDGRPRALPYYTVDPYGNPIGSAGTSTVTQVASSASDGSLLAANTSRKGVLFFNDSTAILYLLYGTGTSSTTNYSVQIPAKGYFEDPFRYTGGFHGIWSAANGFVYITELT